MNHRLAPRPKVAAGGAAGSLGLVVIFVAGEFGLEVSPEVSAAVVTIVSFVASYFKKD